MTQPPGVPGEATAPAGPAQTGAGSGPSGLRQEWVDLPGGRPRLALRTADGQQRAFLLVHGLASNARLWDGVAAELVRAGHRVVAVDQRGHGLSEEPARGYDTDTCADDLAALIEVLGLTGRRGAPVVVGQSWGGNVVLSLAARHPGAVAAVCCVDGGWIRLSEVFASFDDCWAALEPPRLDGLRYEEVEARIRTWLAGWPPEGVEGTLANLVRLPDGGVRARLRREHHRDIVASLFAGDPVSWYGHIPVPVLLCPATGPDDPPQGGPEPADPAAERARATRAAVATARRLLPDGEVSWYPGAHHDLHAEQPQRLAEDLLRLAGRAGAAGEGEA